MDEQELFEFEAIETEAGPIEVKKESLLASDRFRLTMAGIMVNVLIVVLAKYLNLDPAELVALIAGNAGLFGNLVAQRTKRNVSSSVVYPS